MPTTGATSAHFRDIIYSCFRGWRRLVQLQHVGALCAARQYYCEKVHLCLWRKHTTKMPGMRVYSNNPSIGKVVYIHPPSQLPWSHTAVNGWSIWLAPPEPTHTFYSIFDLLLGIISYACIFRVWFALIHISLICNLLEHGVKSFNYMDLYIDASKPRLRLVTIYWPP